MSTSGQYSGAVESLRFSERLHDYTHTDHYDICPYHDVSNGVMPDFHGVTQNGNKMALSFEMSRVFVLVETTNASMGGGTVVSTKMKAAVRSSCKTSARESLELISFESFVKGQFEEQDEHCQSPTAVNVSDQTIRNRPHEGGLRARRPVVGPVLTGQHRRARLAFATEHQNWQIRHRRLVLFTDESRFYLSTWDRRDRLWRHCGERCAACNIIQHDWFGGGSVMVWGGISLEGRTNLYRLDNGTVTESRGVAPVYGRWFWKTFEGLSRCTHYLPA
ncbi:hypothetical protein NFI96_000426 [Prochilodus magdalenae]|nr:hypothetical protein NFI96_000426 [Prochilodus magdalenae]